MSGMSLEVLWAEILGVISRIGEKIQGVKAHLSDRLDDRFRKLDSEFSAVNLTLAGSIGIRGRRTFMLTVLEEAAWLLAQLRSFGDGFAARADKVLVGRVFQIGLNRIEGSLDRLRVLVTVG